jgi:hypothetical protein
MEKNKNKKVIQQNCPELFPAPWTKNVVLSKHGTASPTSSLRFEPL